MFDKYSKENYKKLEEELATVEQTIGDELSEDPLLTGTLLPDKINELIQNTINEKKHEILKKMEKLQGKAHDEALELNKEYNDLLEKVQEALKNLHDFEKEKLKMHTKEKTG